VVLDEPDFVVQRGPFFGPSRACESEENSSKNASVPLTGAQKNGRPVGVGAIARLLIRRVCFQTGVRSIRIDRKAAASYKFVRPRLLSQALTRSIPRSALMRASSSPMAGGNPDCRSKARSYFRVHRGALARPVSWLGQAALAPLVMS
jgi:hypothetical protein